MTNHRVKMAIKNKFVGCFVIVLLCSACSSESNHALITYPDQESTAFQQFTRQCSSCHRPPMPDVHIAKDWNAIVVRMQQHKEQRGLLVMNHAEQQQVLAYLQANAKKDVIE
ncbi:MAG: hypothetical protein COB41_02490 [Proteobacteria bacterium]|nr:MAG: hypothetical protein COB41_02490 [Pseudomonadota bacterium]